MTYLKLFPVCMFKNPNLADIFTNLAKKKIINSAEFMEFFFSKSASNTHNYINYTQLHKLHLTTSTTLNYINYTQLNQLKSTLSTGLQKDGNGGNLFLTNLRFWQPILASQLK